MRNINQLTRKKQAIGGLCGVAVLVFIIGVVLLFNRHRAHRRQASSAPDMTGIVSSDFTAADSRSALENQQSQLDNDHTMLQRLQKRLAEQSHQEAKQLHDLEQMVMGLKQRVYRVDNTLKKHKTEKNEPSATHNAATDSGKMSHTNNPGVFAKRLTHAFAPPAKGHDQWPADQGSQPMVPSSLTIEHFQFHYPHPQATHHNAHNYVPSGTFVKAVLLGGADANASVNGQSNTSPILLRLLDNGTLPNGQHSSLKGCFVLASIYGDISSERGEVRLARLSCTRHDGTVLDKAVQGYASFAGKEGIRGTPVMRNGKIIAWAGLSGLLSGFGKALQESQVTQNASSLVTTNTLDSHKTLQYGAYGGVGTALDRLSDYYIKRADQYHPIIEVGSGNVATVVFQQGFSLVTQAAMHKPATTKVSTASTTMIPQDLVNQIAHAHLGQPIKGAS